MRRRTYLRDAAGASLVVLAAGCTEGSLEDADQPAGVLEDVFDAAEIDLPVDHVIEEIARRIEAADGESVESVDALGEYLSGEDIDHERLEESEDAGETVLELEYAVEDPAAEGNVHGLGTVAGGYAALVRGGYDGDLLEAHVVDGDGETFGHFEVETAWAESYDAGDLSTRSYASEVLHTLETR